MESVVPNVAHVFPVLHNAVADGVADGELLPVDGARLAHHNVLNPGG